MNHELWLICRSQEIQVQLNLAATLVSRNRALHTASWGSKQRCTMLLQTTQRISRLLICVTFQDVTALYTLGRVLGRGQFGTTRLAEDKVTGEQLACKSISKRKLTYAALLLRSFAQYFLVSFVLSAVRLLGLHMFCWLCNGWSLHCVLPNAKQSACAPLQCVCVCSFVFVKLH